MKRALPVASIIFVSFVALLFIEPIAQSIEYHNFADNRPFWNVQNFWNVISNLPFLIIGIWGLRIALRTKAPTSILMFFIGIILVGPGSAYYHHGPSNATLVWDRLPMTLAFTSFFIWICTVFVSESFNKFLLPALSVGILSVIYWAVYDDLRMYIWVQFSPMLVVLVVLLFYKGPEGLKKYIIGVIGCYVIAKLCESFDEKIYHATGSIISGHAIKHIFSAFAPLFAGLYFLKQKDSLSSVPLK